MNNVSNSQTEILNSTNINAVRGLIAKKQSDKPLFVSSTSVITDMDHHPYTRWYRGVYYYPNPIVMEREAGWRTINNSCYEPHQPFQPEPEPNSCFQSACTTVYPCFGEENKTNRRINEMCIVKNY
jgi:hypothetical protein